MPANLVCVHPAIWVLILLFASVSLWFAFLGWVSVRVNLINQILILRLNETAANAHFGG